MNLRRLAILICFAAVWLTPWETAFAFQTGSDSGNSEPQRIEQHIAEPNSNRLAPPATQQINGFSLKSLQGLFSNESSNENLIGQDQGLVLETLEPQSTGGFDVGTYLGEQADELTSRKGTGSAIKIALVLGALSLAPSILLMTTCYIRIVVVLSLLKQAFGAQQLPPTQVVTTLSLFLTILIMTPVWMEIKTNAIDPYASSEKIDWQEAWERGITPIKKFMGTQIEAAGNTDSIAMIYKYAPNKNLSQPSHMNEVPLNVLLPAFVISELKVAFLIGFQIFLPFLIIDLIVSSVTVSLGMMMLPPTMVSLPLKLILFVMVDGWNLVVGLLLQSFAPVI